MRMRHAIQGAALLLVAGTAAAQSAMGPQASGAGEQLPVREVSLFRSGVGYFFRQGTIDGDAAIELSFKADQINDILKSMVVLDLDGGQVDSIGYASSEPLEHRLAGFGLDLSGSPSVADLLRQLRGVRVSLRLVDQTITGKVLGVEERQVATDEGEPIVEHFVTIVTDAGLETHPLRKVDRFTIADAKLAAELEKALAALAESRDPDKKQVLIRLSGEGERQVMAGYVTEMPVWKMSYRLMLEEGEAARLQGWAIVENTTDSDWEDVRLSLVSGQPVSFIMNLYEPLFIDRPQVEVDVAAVAQAPVYEGAYMRGKSVELAEESLGRRRAGTAGGVAAAPAADAYTAERLSFGAAVANLAAAATGSVEGEQFFFQLNRPITLARRQSAMVPVLNENLPIRRVSIFNASHLADHPMRGVRLENETGMALMPGPVTVFDGNLYAGDARLPRVAEEGEQIISFAIDLDVDVKVDTASRRFGRTLRIVKGVLTEIERLRQTTTYHLSNRSAQPRDVLIEHPKTSEWKLVSPKEADADTPNFHRFTLPVAAQERESLDVVQERELWSRTALGNIGLSQLEALIVDGDMGKSVRQALETLIARQHEIAQLERQIQDVNRTLGEIEQDQQRIRENIGKVDRDSELYDRYMNKLAEQETQIEDLQERRVDLADTLARKRNDLAEHLANLDISD